tara:strand:+ start:181 stop:810 length:630 start_codon:yes stop_codon:yes gene_type:complete
MKYIIFDVGGVLQLTDYDDLGKGAQHVTGAHEYMAKKLKINVDTWFDSIDSAYVKSITNEIPKNKVISIISHNLRISPKRFERLMIKAYKRIFKKNKRLYRLAKKLRKKGYKTGILSDQWHLSEEALIPPKDNKKFNPIIVSSRVGLRKPDPKIYKLLIKKCKCKANEILFVDNRNWNLKPAKKLGIKTILFKDNKQLIKSLKKLKILK